ncbi:MAG TPA: ABC transporter substrate-binding protein [Acidimicrobiia bacterium]|nr:ABC transporter substrate-binding protein [Acidimicrobiia bacterium]
MRKLLAAILAVGLVTGLAVSGAGASVAEAKGALKVGTNLPAPGFWNGNDPDSISGGFEYDLAKAIGAKLGYSGVKVVNVSFDGLVAGKAKGFDFAFSQVTITKARKKVVDFSVPYFNSDQGILVRKGTTVADGAAAKKLKWGVQTATTAQDYLKNTLKADNEPSVYQETSQAFAALQAGQVDAVLLDTAIVLQQAAASNGQFQVVGQFKTGEQYGAVFNKGSKIEKKVNNAIKALKADGTVSQLAEKNLGGDPAKVPVIKP